MFRKVGIWPAKMIVSPADSLSFATLAKYGSESSSYPLIQHRVCRSVTLFEVLEPSFQCPVDIDYDRLHTSTILSFGL